MGRTKIVYFKTTSEAVNLIDRYKDHYKIKIEPALAQGEYLMRLQKLRGLSE
jgi:hypothetical protein